MDKLSRIGKVAEFRELLILDFSRDKLSRKKGKIRETHESLSRES